MFSSQSHRELVGNASCLGLPSELLPQVLPSICFLNKPPGDSQVACFFKRSWKSEFLCEFFLIFEH